MQNNRESPEGGMFGRVRSMLQAQIGRVKGKREGIIIAYVLVGMLSAALLFLIPESILTYLIIPVAAFALPYYMGNKRLKHIIIAGLLFLVVISLIFDASFSSALYSSGFVTQASPVSNPGFYFKSGDVKPSIGGSGTQFSFHAGLYRPSNATAVPQVVVVLFPTSSSSTGLNASMVAVSNTSAPNGEILTEYGLNTSLPANQVYVFHFSANVSGSWSSTSESVVSTVPEAQTFLNLMAYNIFLSTIIVFVFIGAFYYGVVLVFVLLRKSNRRKDAMLAGKASPPGRIPGRTPKKPSAATTKAVRKEKWECSSCGAEVESNAEKCGSCGEKFD